MQLPEAYWLNKDSRTFLSRGYLAEGQTAEERIKEIALAAGRRLGKEIGEELERDILKGWISLSSPIWSNFGHGTDLPISCNGSYIPDDTGHIFRKLGEIGMMSKFGAGTSAYFGDLRPRNAPIGTRGFVSDGTVHFMGMFQSAVETISQSGVRRGNLAVYLPIEHPDIKEFLSIREEGHPIQHLSIGVTVTDAWMEDMIAGDKDKRKLWTRIIQKRFETGYPYVVFIDNMNNGRPQWYKDKGLKILASNLCTEIALPSSENESFVCDLLSVNALHYDEWKDSGLVERAIALLDAVLSEYVEKIESNPEKFRFMDDALRFAKRHRALGLGILGWHSYLQSKMIPFGSIEAKKINVEMWKHINRESKEASRKLAMRFGEAEVTAGYGMRNATTMAIAPTTSSSFILGQVSPSIEPENSNYYVKDLAKGKFTYKNPYLKKLLKEKGLDNAETWQNILLHGGSVQHMTAELTEHERDVFKTFGEINQIEIIMQAADRQQYIDQGQSLNLMIHPDSPIKDVNLLMIEAWKLGIKALYYQRSTSPTQEFARSLLSCVACEA